MVDRKFQPGFRVSTLDCVVIVMGAVASVYLWATAWWIGFVVAFVVAHFFVFCNIFRVARPLELAWGALFVSLAYCTVAFGQPPWPITIGASLAATVGVIILEMRKPSYHGILWQFINPRLPEWWATNSSVVA
jgi:hypothetical protein